MSEKNKNRETEVRMSGCIGDFHEELDEVRVTVIWHIPDFFSLNLEKNCCFQSPVFFPRDLACYLAFYPNGIPDGYPNNLYLQLCRVDSGPPKDVTIKVILGEADEEKTNSCEKRWTLSKSNITCCSIYKSYLERRKYFVAPTGVLKIYCSLVEHHAKSMDDSLLKRLWNLSLQWKSVFSREDADLSLKLKDGVAKAHRLVLSSRSPVFDRMFSLDTRERNTGEVDIEDVNEESFRIVLSYIYSGDPIGLSPENAWDVYKASHKYELHELTKCCREYLVASLTVESVCDIIAAANLYEDERLMKDTITYFGLNRKNILKTAPWKTLKENNSKLACEVLESSLD